MIVILWRLSFFCYPWRLSHLSQHIFLCIMRIVKFILRVLGLYGRKVVHWGVINTLFILFEVIFFGVGIIISIFVHLYYCLLLSLLKSIKVFLKLKHASFQIHTSLFIIIIFETYESIRKGLILGRKILERSWTFRLVPALFHPKRTNWNLHTYLIQNS